MPITLLQGPTISAGQTLSSVVDISGSQGKALSGIIVPDAWTNAPVSFQLSYDNVEFRDLFTTDGFELLLTIVPGTRLVFDSRWSITANFIKFRSGPRAYPVTQTANRQFRTVIVT